MNSCVSDVYLLLSRALLGEAERSLASRERLRERCLLRLRCDPRVLVEWRSLTALARFVCLSWESERERLRRGGDTLSLQFRSLWLNRVLEGVRDR